MRIEDIREFVARPRGALERLKHEYWASVSRDNVPEPRSKVAELLDGPRAAFGELNVAWYLFRNAGSARYAPMNRRIS